MRRLFLVEERHGGPWDWSKGLRDQEGFDDHAALMDRFVDEGFIVLGGPLNEREVLLIVAAPDEVTVRDRFAADPWITNGMLTIERVRPWEILLDGSPGALHEP